MDKILKNVQGYYINHFTPHINYIIGLVLQRAKNRDDQLKLVKMFKTWEVLDLFAPNTLNEIARL